MFIYSWSAHGLPLPYFSTSKLIDMLKQFDVFISYDIQSNVSLQKVYDILINFPSCFINKYCKYCKLISGFIAL